MNFQLDPKLFISPVFSLTSVIMQKWKESQARSCVFCDIGAEEIQLFVCLENWVL